MDYFLGTAACAKSQGARASNDMPRRIVSGPTSWRPPPSRVNSMPHTAYSRSPRAARTNVRSASSRPSQGANSREIEDLAVEAERLAATGVRELILVAQDLAYGVDLPGRPTSMTSWLASLRSTG